MHNPVVPGREIVVADGPREDLARPGRVGEVVAREARDRATPVVGETAWSHVFEEQRGRIASDDDPVGSRRERTVNSRERHAGHARGETERRALASRFDQRDIDTLLDER